MTDDFDQRRVETQFARKIHARYEDPLSSIWLYCAESVGLRVVRSDDVFASYDGQGTLTLGSDASLDADDCLAQMIFHELCHSLALGAESPSRADWGLCNLSDRDDDIERATLRIQASYLDALELREVLAPTTDFRMFYDRLGETPLETFVDEEDASVPLAQKAWAEREEHPYHNAILRGLRGTKGITEALRESGVERTELLLTRAGRVGRDVAPDSER